MAGLEETMVDMAGPSPRSSLSSLNHYFLVQPSLLVSNIFKKDMLKIMDLKRTILFNASKYAIDDNDPIS